jgi:AI-2E family transporter
MPSSSAEESVPPASGPALASILALQVGAVLIAALYVAREVLVPITVAILLSFVLSPLVNLLRRLRLGPVPSVLISVLIAIGIMGLVGTLIGSQVAQLAGRAPEYAQTIETKVHKVREYAVGKLSGILPHLGYDVRPNPEHRVVTFVDACDDAANDTIPEHLPKPPAVQSYPAARLLRLRRQRLSE